MENGQPQRFPTTNWTSIDQARSDPEVRWTMLVRYRASILDQLRLSGLCGADAEEFTQGFLLRVFEGHMLELAKPRSASRFRDYVKATLRNYVIDKIRERARDAGRHRPIDPGIIERLADATGGDSWRTFDRQWATATFAEAVRRIEEDARRRQMKSQWSVFEARFLRPMLDGTEPIPMQQLLEQHQLSSPQHMYGIVSTLKEKLRREVLRVVTETIGDDDDADEELRALLEVLSG